MGKVVLGVTISLDGFAEDISGSVGALYPDLELLHTTDVLKESIQTPGAVVMAWKEFAMAENPDWFAGNYEYQLPIFVVTNRIPMEHPKETAELTFTFVTDGFVSAIHKAVLAAGEKVVTIIGSADTTRHCLKSRLVDELQVDILPIFLYEGFRPFEDLKAQPINLEKIKLVELPGGRTHIRFSVRY